MITLADDFRSRSSEQHEAAMKLLKLPEFATDPKKQAMFIVGKVTANTLQLLSEMVDYLRVSEKMDAASQQRAQAMEKNDAIRNAAIAENWEEFDKLVEEFGGGGQGGDRAE